MQSSINLHFTEEYSYNALGDQLQVTHDHCSSFPGRYGRQRDPRSQDVVGDSHAPVTVPLSYCTSSILCKEWHLRPKMTITSHEDCLKKLY